MGMATTFVLTIASMVTWIIYYFLLQPFHWSFCRRWLSS